MVVTGATGYIASWIVKELLAQGEKTVPAPQRLIMPHHHQPLLVEPTHPSSNE